MLHHLNLRCIFSLYLQYACIVRIVDGLLFGIVRISIFEVGLSGGVIYSHMHVVVSHEVLTNQVGIIMRWLGLLDTSIDPADVDAVRDSQLVVLVAKHLV